MAADIYLYNKRGEAVLYQNAGTLEADTPTPGHHETYTHGVVEGKNIVPDFSDGDMAVSAASGKLWRDVTVEKPTTLIPGNVKRGVAVAGITGSFVGGAGWNPASGDYSWTYAFFNTFWTAALDSVLQSLTYDASGECEIARFYTAENVRGQGLEYLVAIDFSAEVNDGYCLAYRRTFFVGTDEEWESTEPIYATQNIPASGGGTWAYAGWSYSNIALSYNGETGSLIPVIDEPVSRSPVGWSDYWAGYEISFGDFVDSTGATRVRDIISNVVTSLSASDFVSWFRPSNRNVSEIRPHFFEANYVLETVEFHPLVYSIGESAFENCTALTEVGWRIQANGLYVLSYIGARAFYGCSLLTTVDIHGEVYFSRIEDYAFANCPRLTTVTIRKYVSPPTLGTDVFDTTSLQHIYVPASAVSAYKTAAGWSAYASYISAIPS